MYPAWWEKPWASARVMGIQVLAFTRTLDLPTYEGESITLKKLDAYQHDDRIKKLFYPVFPYHQNADYVIQWLSKWND